MASSGNPKKKGQSKPAHGSLFSFLSSSGPAASQSSGSEKDLDFARNEIKRLEEENAKIKVEAKKQSEELSKAKEDVQKYQNRARDLQEKNDRLNRISEVIGMVPETTDMVNRIADLERVLDYTGISDFLLKLKTFNKTTFEPAEFLAQCLEVKTADVFEDELKEARSKLAPLLGNMLLDILVNQAKDKPSTPSSNLIRVVSRTLLVNMASVCRKERAAKPSSEGLSKRTVLKRFTNVFQLASWSLPTSEDRSLFENLLEQVFDADRDIDKATVGILRGKEFSLSLCGSGKLFSPQKMEALDCHGRHLVGSLSEEEEVVGTVGLGLTSQIPDKQSKGAVSVVVPVQVVLKSTLLRAINQVERTPGDEDVPSGGNQELDGRP